MIQDKDREFVVTNQALLCRRLDIFETRGEVSNATVHWLNAMMQSNAELFKKWVRERDIQVAEFNRQYAELEAESRTPALDPGSAVPIEGNPTGHLVPPQQQVTQLISEHPDIVWRLRKLEEDLEGIEFIERACTAGFGAWVQKWVGTNKRRASESHPAFAEFERFYAAFQTSVADFRREFGANA